MIIFNEGKSIRDFIDVEDVVKVYKVLLSKKFEGVIGIGTGKGISIKNLIKKAGVYNNVIFFLDLVVISVWIRCLPLLTGRRR